MIKIILGVKSVWSVRRDAWCSDVGSFNLACRRCVDGLLYWLEIKVSILLPILLHL
jgi:hypothetical protein